MEPAIHHRDHRHAESLSIFKTLQRPAGRAGTPDEVGDLAEFLMSSRGRWISGSDFLIDGGTTASYWYGDLQYLKATH
ncbi:MAG: SDR family oxidoreductase [Synergistaceae bacterium]|nr:SDR family oxidoreductase [Synergistaceae bacterium]MBR0095160.1 SDR family oxidoreductase [Synergistaceae bacterium]